MTYCVGWKYKNSVYLVADSAITKLSEIYQDVSSFGEFHRVVKGANVEEGLLKLVPISENIIIAFAGNVQLATALIEYLKENLLEKIGNQDLRYLIANIEKSLGPFSRDRDVQLIIAKSNTSENTDLIYWDTINGICNESKNIYQLGSMESYHSEITNYLFDVMSNGNIEEERLLTIMLGCIQSYGVHDNMIDQNIGGIIWGVRSQTGSIFWQEDTNYVIYNKDLTNLTWVTAFELDNVLIVNSTQQECISCFANSISLNKEINYIETWGDYILNYFKDNKSRYWIFINSNEKIITIIRKNDKYLDGKYVNIQKTEGDKYSLLINSLLMEILKKPILNTDNEGVPFRLNFLND